MVITSNDPSAGYVSWSGVQIEYKSVTYTITAGNSNKPFIWWDFTTPTAFQEADTMPTMTDNDFIAIYNDSGTYNLVGIRSRQVHGDVILAGTIPGTALEETYVETTGNESVGGVKTFTDYPVLPSDDPTTDLQVTHKKYVDNVLDSIGASDVSVAEIAVATYDDMQEWINNTQSAGYFSGGTITDAGSGKINISALTGFLKITDSELGVTKSFDLGAASNFELTDNSVNYIFVNYVGGPKFDVTTDRTTIELNRHFTLGRVYRKGTAVHIVQSGVKLTNHARDAHERLIKVRGFERASGGVITETGNRYIESTAGLFYLGQNSVDTGAKDTSGADVFTRHYHSGGVWVSDSKSQIAEGDVYQYDNGTDLVNISNNKYGVFWVYIHFDADLHVIVGRGDYTLAQAEAATLPDLPDEVGEFATLAAKIILLEDATNFYGVQTAYEQFFPLNGAVNHNDLGGIQGGEGTDYYHIRPFTDEADKFLDASGNWSVGAGGGVTDHGALTGLADDDHSQYHNDTRGDARYKQIGDAPTAHKVSHQSGGSDNIKIDDLTEADDNTDLDSSATRHGLLKKLTNEADKFLDASGNWSVGGGGVTDHGALTGLDDDDHSAVYLGKATNSAYTPSQDYHPSTKKYVDDTASAGGGVAQIEGQFVFTASGNLTVDTEITLDLFAAGTLTIQEVFASVKTSPVGSSIRLDINKNGTTIFINQANRPEIADGASSGTSGIPDIVNLVEGDKLTLDADQIGSETAGGDLTVSIRFTQQSGGTTTPQAHAASHLGGADDMHASLDTRYLKLIGGTLSDDLLIYDPVNDGNPQIHIGSADANEGHIQAVYDSGAQTLDYLLISTDSAGEGDIIINSASGFVGFGTTNPFNLLDIRSVTSGRGINLQVEQTTQNNMIGIKFKTSDNTTDNLFYKSGIFAVDNGLSNARNDLYFLLDNAEDTGNVALSDVKMVILSDGKVGFGGVTTPLAQVHIDQSVSDAAIPVLALDQADLSEGFINFIGTSAASAVGPISSWTAGNAIQGFVRAEINGVQRWLAFYDDPTS